MTLDGTIAAGGCQRGDAVVGCGCSHRCRHPDPSRIVIKDFMFVPMALTINAGSSVTWANTDDEPHTVVSDTGLFRSGASTRTKASRSNSTSRHLSLYLFDSPRMVGTIVVQ